MARALVRKPDDAIARCVSTWSGAPLDARRFADQHDAYVRALIRVGVDVTVLPADPGHPDGVFVEDMAVVLPHAVVFTRPGHPSRLGEQEAVKHALSPLFAVQHQITDPGLLDGGDVLVVRDRMFVGLTERTNEEGYRQMAAFASAAGLKPAAVPVRGALHLKSAVTAVDDDALVVAPGCVDPGAFEGFEVFTTAAADAYGANVLRANGYVFVSKNFNAVRDFVRRRGLPLLELETTEIRKADAALTCCSILW